MKRIKVITLSLTLLLTVVAQGADQLVTIKDAQPHQRRTGFSAVLKLGSVGELYVTTNVKDLMKALGLAQYQNFLRSIRRLGRVPIPNAVSKVAPRFENPNTKSI
ncbi:MAG: hypothetical protein NTU72_03965 [Fimbriimonadales bacterium]|nr:hypothetical protein [Fimbriimonadales bacterium]